MDVEAKVKEIIIKVMIRIAEILSSRIYILMLLYFDWVKLIHLFYERVISY